MNLPVSGVPQVCFFFPLVHCHLVKLLLKEQAEETATMQRKGVNYTSYVHTCLIWQVLIHCTFGLAAIIDNVFN